MSRWLILVACGFAVLPGRADIPGPGMMSVTANGSGPSLRAVDESMPDKPKLPVEVLPPVPKKHDAPVKLAQLDEAAPTLPEKVEAPEKATQADAPTDVVPDNGGFRDTINAPKAKAAPDVQQKVPAVFAEVDYLRKHNDGTMAAAYLRQVISSQNNLPQDRARAILILADTLASVHREAEALCWLKMWMQLYPSRPEIGGVAYRVGTIYTHMGLPDLARDAYYMTLAHTINQGQVGDDESLKQYQRLTVGTLWALAANEYQAGQWQRAAELLNRYRLEAKTGSEASMQKATYLQADCLYQQRKVDDALAFYEETLTKYPFNELAPEGRLRLFHLYVMKKQPEKAKEELQALAWTVRTVWPKQETYWQKQTAELLMALNQKDPKVLPALFQTVSSKLPNEGKSWQDAINHYDALVGYQAVSTQGNIEVKTSSKYRLPEEDQLLAMNKTMNQLLPTPGTTR